MPYFDHNATTPLLPAAREAWLQASDEAWANPSSPYRLSARVHRLLNHARERVAAHLGVEAGEIVFTAGATEANNAVISWAARELPGGAPVLISATEHPSVLEAARTLFGERAHDLAPVHGGAPDPEEVRHRLAGAPAGFVACMAANNETGALAATRAIDEVCHERRAWYLCDASQWIGRMPSHGLAPHAFIVACAHKFGGPKGVGFLRVPPHATGFHAGRGGEQESGRRAGTENYPAIAAMVAALEHAEGLYPTINARAAWADDFVRTLGRRLPGVVLTTGTHARLWNTVSVCMPAHENTRWVVRLDKLGFEVSTGSACASGSAAPSHVLAALGLGSDAARRTIRVSSGWETTERDWQVLAEAIINVWEQLQCDGAAGDVVHRN